MKRYFVVEVEDGWQVRERKWFVLSEIVWFYRDEATAEDTAERLNNLRR